MLCPLSYAAVPSILDPVPYGVNDGRCRMVWGLTPGPLSAGPGLAGGPPGAYH